MFHRLFSSACCNYSLESQLQFLATMSLCPTWQETYTITDHSRALNRTAQSRIFTYHDEIHFLFQDPLGHMGTCRSAECGGGGGGGGGHPAVAMMPCSQAKPWGWDPAKRTLTAPNGQVMTDQSCGAPVGDRIIMWEYVLTVLIESMSMTDSVARQCWHQYSRTRCML